MKILEKTRYSLRIFFCDFSRSFFWRSPFWKFLLEFLLSFFGDSSRSSFWNSSDLGVQSGIAQEIYSEINQELLPWLFNIFLKFFFFVSLLKKYFLWSLARFLQIFSGIISGIPYKIPPGLSSGINPELFFLWFTQEILPVISPLFLFTDVFCFERICFVWIHIPFDFFGMNRNVNDLLSKVDSIVKILRMSFLDSLSSSLYDIFQNVLMTFLQAFFFRTSSRIALVVLSKIL